jgi:hypothetical protein
MASLFGGLRRSARLAARYERSADVQSTPERQNTDALSGNSTTDDGNDVDLDFADASDIMPTFAPAPQNTERRTLPHAVTPNDDCDDEHTFPTLPRSNPDFSRERNRSYGKTHAETGRVNAGVSSDVQLFGDRDTLDTAFSRDSRNRVSFTDSGASRKASGSRVNLHDARIFIHKPTKWIKPDKFCETVPIELYL